MATSTRDTTPCFDCILLCTLLTHTMLLTLLLPTLAASQYPSHPSLALPFLPFLPYVRQSCKGVLDRSIHVCGGTVAGVLGKDLCTAGGDVIFQDNSDGSVYNIFLRGPGIILGQKYRILLGEDCALTGSSFLLTEAIRREDGLNGLWVTGSSSHCNCGGDGGKIGVRARVLVVQHSSNPPVTIGCTPTPVA